MSRIDTSNWKEFKIDDLFYKLDLKGKNKSFNKAFDLSTEMTDEFNLPLVNAKHYNNGIMYYGRKDEWESESMTIDIVADGAASTGDVYAQPQKTGVLYNAYLIKLKNEEHISEYVLHYLACVIEKCIKSHFGYENKCTWNKVKEKNIKLPVDEQNNPNWKYMEEYMKIIEIEAQNKIDLLSSVI